MPIESDGHSRGNPRMFELFEGAPKEGPSPTVFAFGQFVDFLKVAGQPVQGPWPPHQQPRPEPEDIEAGPVAIPDPQADTLPRNRLSIDGPLPQHAAPEAGASTTLAASTGTTEDGK